jgi:uncharacterized protein (TIGR02996 family)
MSSLERALAALAGGDDEASLEELLHAWRCCRAPRLAACISKVSDRLRARQEALFKRRHWLTVEREHKAADLGRLLMTLEAGRWSASDELPLLLRWPADPRLVPLISRWKDGISELGRSCGRWLGEIRPPEELSAEELKVLARIETAVAGTMVSGEDLLAQIYERPDDLGLRLVYADWLVERGDPRGELITLQLRRAEGQGTPADLRREGVLLRSYRKTWLGGIAAAVDKHVVFERGFASSCRIVDPSLVPATVGRPEWSTVEELIFHGARRALADLAGHPVMRSLRALTAEVSVLAALVSGKVVPPLVRLGVEPAHDHQIDETEVLRETDQLSSVETVEVGGPHDAWVGRCRFFPSVRRLVVTRGEAAIAGWIPALLATPGKLTWIGLRPMRRGHLAFSRREDETLWTLEVRQFPAANVLALLERLPPDTLGKVSLSVSGPEIDRALLRHRGLVR